MQLVGTETREMVGKGCGGSRVKGNDGEGCGGSEEGT